MTLRSKVLRASASGLLFLCGSSAFAQPPAWPGKPMRIVVMASPGGLVDVAARVVAPHLSTALGQPVVVENRPGGGGNIATEYVARSTPDGTTLLSTGSNHAVNQTLIPNPGFDYERDVAPVSMIAQGNMLLVANPNLPTATVAELIQLAKSKPKSVSIGHGPIGTPGHIGVVMLQSMADLDLIIVAYKGIAAAVPDIVSGQVQLGIGAFPAVTPLIQSGRLKALAVTGPSRAPQFPSVPTVAESGIPGYDVTTWLCFMTTGGTPSATLERLSAEIRRILELPDVRETFEKQGTVAKGSTPAELATAMKAEATKWSKVFKNAKFEVK